MEFPETNGEDRRPEALPLRLLKARTILVSGGVDQELAEEVIAKLLLLDSESHDPIRVFVSSPGGAVYPGYAIYDMMRYIESPIITIGAGYVASMGVPILLGAPKDKRFALPNARFLLHQPSGGAGGQLQDIRIQAKEIIGVREKMNKLIADETGQDIEKVKKDSDRDFWMSAEEALDYGLITKIITKSTEAG